jgi:hypothetical protein
MRRRRPAKQSLVVKRMVVPPDSPLTVAHPLLPPSPAADDAPQGLQLDKVVASLFACLPVVVDEAERKRVEREQREQRELEEQLASRLADAHVDAPLMWCEAVGDHVIALRWPRMPEGVSEAELMASYEEAAAVLATRRAPFGLVHDFRAVEHLGTLGPIACKILPDAISIASGGLVKRVAVLHSFRSGLFFYSLASLSPVRPCKCFRQPETSQCMEWAGAWAADEAEADRRSCT